MDPCTGKIPAKLCPCQKIGPANLRASCVAVAVARANFKSSKSSRQTVSAGAARVCRVAIMNTSQPVSSAINGVQFGFLTADDIRTLSVKRITNPTTFDSLLHPVPGGLHDHALGAVLDNA